MTASMADDAEPAPMGHSGYGLSPIRNRQNARNFTSRTIRAVLLPTFAIVSATSTVVPTVVTTSAFLSPLTLENGKFDMSSLLTIRGGHEMAVGSSCSTSEGEWNCMTTSFQRCASGQWSVVMNTADGTICVCNCPPPPYFRLFINFGRPKRTSRVRIVADTIVVGALWTYARVSVSICRLFYNVFHKLFGRIFDGILVDGILDDVL